MQITLGVTKNPQLLVKKIRYKDTAGFVKSWALSSKERIEKEKKSG